MKIETLNIIIFCTIVLSMVAYVVSLKRKRDALKASYKEIGPFYFYANETATGYSAYSAQYPIVSVGETIFELQLNLKQAVELYLEKEVNLDDIVIIA